MFVRLFVVLPAHLKQIKWIKISKVSKILIFQKCSNILIPQKAFLKCSYYQIVSIVKKSGLMCYAKSCYSETSTLVDFTWEIVVQYSCKWKGKVQSTESQRIYTIWDWDRSPHWYVFFNFSLVRKPLIFLKVHPLKAENWWFYCITAFITLVHQI